FPGYTLAVIDYFFRKLPIRGERDVLLLHRSVYPDLFYLLLYLLLPEQIYALLKDLLHPFLPDTFAEVNKVTGIKRVLVLKVNLTAEVLTIRTVYIPLHYCLITKIIYLLEQ